MLTVLSCDPDLGHVQCPIENKANMGERKNMNFPGMMVELTAFSEKDVKGIVELGIAREVDSGRDHRILPKTCAISKRRR